MAKTLNDVIWKEFKVKTIFPDIEKCKCGNAGNLEDGHIPYVGATNRNNGTMRYVKASEKLITKGNCIVFICDGQGSVGYSIYKAEDFVGSTTLKVGRNKFLNYYNALFIIGALDKNRCIYSYGYKRTEPRLKNETIYLPVNLKGEPDYKFREEYIKEREEKLKQRYKEYISNKISKLYKKLETNKIWKDFALTDIFIPEKGNQNNMSSLTEGNLPLVSAKKVDNGYKMFATKNDKKTFPANIITLNNDGDGGAGIAYYQPAKHLLDSHVTALIPIDKNLSKNVLLYLATAITNQRAKFGHGYSINSNRLKIFRFMLPVNSKGEPDYKYMEDYMKYLEQKKLLEYLEYIK